MFGTPEIQPMKSSEESGATGGIQSGGIDKTKKSSSNTSNSQSNSNNSENEFPEAAIDEERAGMELALARYIQEAERKESMRVKMSENDAQTLLSEGGNASSSGHGRSEVDDASKEYEDSRSAATVKSKSRSSNSSSSGNKDRRSHK